jgi:hypothetical protein
MTAIKEMLTTKELVKQFNDHTHIKTEGHASLFKTGVIDVDLLQKAGLTVPSSLDECSVVGVKFAAMTRNHAKNRIEPVFSVSNMKGDFIGHYFASAFKSLTL